MPGTWLRGYDNPTVHETADKLKMDAALYFFGCALASDLAQFPEGKVVDPKKPLDLFSAVGVLGEIPIHLQESVPAITAGLIEVLRQFEEDEQVESTASLAEALLNGLKQGFLKENPDIEQYPWMEGQWQIANALIDFLATQETQSE